MFGLVVVFTCVSKLSICYNMMYNYTNTNNIVDKHILNRILSKVLRLCFFFQCYIIDFMYMIYCKYQRCHVVSNL